MQITLLHTLELGQTDNILICGFCIVIGPLVYVLQRKKQTIKEGTAGWESGTITLSLIES